MEFKVREVTGAEKGVAEKEQELLDKHEQELNEEAQGAEGNGDQEGQPHHPDPAGGRGG